MATRSSQTCLDIGDLIDVIDLLKKCGFQGTKWQELGLRLGLLKTTLEALEMKYRGDVYHCQTECLSHWLRRVDNVDRRGGANFNSLSDALRSMNETAVAEKLKHHVLIDIFNKCHTVLSQSLCDSVGIAWLLYAERMLTQEAVSRVVSASPSISNQREALLTDVKEAVQTDPNSLHTFAKVLCTISTNVSLGRTILDDISKYFPTPEVGIVPETIKDHVVLQGTSPSDAAVASNSSSQPLSPQVDKLQVPVPEGLLEKFTSIRMSYGSLFYNVGKIIKQKCCSLKDIKEFLSCCGTVLSRKVKKCRDISSVLHLIQNECSLTNIALLRSVVDEMKVSEAEEHIKTYRTELEEFCKSLSISLCLKERFASIPHLECETVTFIFDWKPEEHVLKDILELLAKVSGKLLKIDYIKRSNSISVTCSFPFHDVGFTVLRMIENIHVLMGQGLKKLTIGNITLWRRQDVRQKELKEQDQDLLQHTEPEVISYIMLEEAEYKLRDTISSREEEAIELKQEISMAQVTEEESLFVQSDTQSIKEVEEEPLHEELTVLRSQFNETQKENEESSGKLSKMKIEYLRSLSSNTDSAAGKLRRGMSFEIDDCKFYLKAMTRPDYQPLVDNKRIIEKLRERITFMNMELIAEKEHNEKIIKNIKDLKEVEYKRQKEKEQENEEMCIVKFSLYSNHPVTGELMDSTLNVHKDELLPSVLNKAYKLMKLAPYIPIERCRLVKYNYECDVMNQSFDLDRFQCQTIGQLVADGARGYDLFLETCKENETFKKYNDGGINLMILVLDLSIREIAQAKPMRCEEGWTIGELKQYLGELFNLNSSCMRLILEEYNDDYSAHNFRHLQNAEISLREVLFRGESFSSYRHKRLARPLLCVSSDPEDCQKDYKDSLMYRYLDIHFNSILLNIKMPPQPEATLLEDSIDPDVREGAIFMSKKEKENRIQIRVDKRITVAQLKEKLAPLIGVSSTNFRVYHKISGHEAHEMKRLDMTLVNVDSGSEFLVTRSRVSREVECKIKLYLLLVNNAEFCKFMMESIVVENTQVREFKKQIIEEAKVQGIDCVLELDKMRLRSKRGVYPGAIYLDQQMIRAEREIYVEPLKKPEMKNHHSQIQIYVIRWRPSQFSVDPVEEIILNNNNSKDVNEKLSELSGVPTEYIYCAESRLFPVEMSCFDIENKLEWHPSLFLSPFIIWNEGQVIYYKDNRETMKELTDKERSEIQEAERARLKKIGAYEF